MKRLIGLMYRDTLKDGSGMLFIFNSEGRYGIWMKNMHFPIDIAWADANKKIVHMMSSAQPCKSFNCPVYKPKLGAKYVLELKAGFFKANGIKLSDCISF